jgi:hypothetical protein
MTRPILCAFALAATLAGTFASPASASVVTMHTRNSNAVAPALGSDADNGAYYRTTVETALGVAPTAGYCDASPAAYSGLSNQATCSGAGGNLAFAFFVDFGVTAAQGANFDVRIGPDFGKGGAVFLDGALLAVNTDDLWWSGSYANAAEIFQFNDLVLTAGNHRLAIYGLEACCDGAQQAQYQIGSSGWNVFARTDGLQPQAVPEPAGLSLSLVALAAAGVPALRRRRGN